MNPTSPRRSKLTIAQFCMRVLFAKPLTGAERQARHRGKLRRAA